MLFTSSWDDGSVHDQRIAELLERFDMPGTFYVPREFSQVSGKFRTYERRLTDSEIRSLAGMHEIGGHGLTHRTLTDMPLQQAVEELEGSKQWLESIINKRVESFCYPNGKWNSAIRDAAQGIGYTYARTTQKLQCGRPIWPLEAGVTMMIHTFPLRRHPDGTVNRQHMLAPIRGYGVRLCTLPSLWASLHSWRRFSRTLFAHCRAHGGVFHLYGHSWEIERDGLWEQLSSFLEFVHNQPDVRYVSNSEIPNIDSN